MKKIRIYLVIILALAIICIISDPSPEAIIGGFLLGFVIGCVVGMWKGLSLLGSELIKGMLPEEEE